MPTKSRRSGETGDWKVPGNTRKVEETCAMHCYSATPALLRRTLIVEMHAFADFFQ